MSTTCAKCGAGAEQDGKPCPACGDTRRIISVGMVESSTVTDSIGFKHRTPGMKKPLGEGFEGHAISRDGSGRRVKKSWYIDRNRAPPWYHERVEDAETGEILRECDEPLADHQCRGSAKAKKSD